MKKYLIWFSATLFLLISYQFVFAQNANEDSSYNFQNKNNYNFPYWAEEIILHNYIGINISQFLGNGLSFQHVDVYDNDCLEPYYLQNVYKLP